MYFKNKSFDNSFNLDENFNDKINYCYSEYVDNYYFCINLKQHKELINFKNYAEKFSFERGPLVDSFMFHGMFHMPRFLTKSDFLSRLPLANDYVRKHPEYNEMLAVARSLNLF